MLGAVSGLRDKWCQELFVPPCLSQLSSAFGLGVLYLAFSAGPESAVRDLPQSAALAFKFTKGHGQETYARLAREITAKIITSLVATSRVIGLNN